MANVTFAKKTKQDYEQGEKVTGRIYFAYTPDTGTGGKIYLDGHCYGGDVNNLSDAAAAYFQQQYDRKIASDAENEAVSKFHVNVTSSQNGTTLLAGTPVTYTITLDYNGTPVDANSSISGFTKTAVGTYKAYYNTNDSNKVAAIAAISKSISYSIPNTEYTATKTASFPARTFYNPILWGTIYDDGGYKPAGITALVEVGDSSGFQYYQDNSNEHFTYRLYRASSAASAYNSFSQLSLTVHQQNAKIVVLVPTAVSGSATAVSGSGSDSISYQIGDFKATLNKYASWSFANYRVFLLDTPQNLGEIIALKK